MFALDVGVLGLLGLVALVAGMEMALEDVLRLGDRPGVDGARLDDVDRRALGRAGDADLVAALGH